MIEARTSRQQHSGDTPAQILEKAVRLARVVPRQSLVQLPPVEAQPAPPPPCEPSKAVSPLQEWVERQRAIPLPPTTKIPWFSIVEEIEPLELARPKIDQIQRVVAHRYEVSRNDLVSARRTAHVVRPRQVAMYLAKVMTLRSLPEVGRRFGGRDHTTVLHAVRKMQAMVDADPAFADEIEFLKRNITEPAHASV